MTSVAIRPMVEADWDGWKPLWDGYLNFYREHLDDETTRFNFARLCRREDGMFGFVADSGSELCGIVHALLHPSTWTTGLYCYLEDLFVTPVSRGGHIGRELIEAVRNEASARGAALVYWQTQEFNGPARSLYDQVAKLTSRRVYEVYDN